VLFNSYTFVFLFLPLVLVGWWSIPTKNARLLFLALASYVFYGWWDFRFVPLMLISTSADFLAALAIERSRRPAARKAYLCALLVFNLGILATFKYYDFFADNYNGIAKLLGVTARLPLLGLILPIGISFYTFNSISYTIDVYRQRIRPAKNFLEFATFVAMFPHLISGPIVRYSDMDDQFAELPTRPDSGQLVVGVCFFVIGMIKKVLIADFLAARLVTPLFGHAHQMVGAWLGSLAYTLQIYFDFSAYSDMAVGLAFFLGLRFPQNFDSPYKSVNISEFWRRWHMSLSFWLRDYLFIPLGGSRGTNLQTARNLALTMFLGGLWHGASWTFVLWGLYHGVLLVVHQVSKRRGWVPRSDAASIAITFVFVTFGWVLFRAPTIHSACATLASMLGAHGVESAHAIVRLVARPELGLLLGGLVLVFWAPNTWELRYPRTRWFAALLAFGFVVCTLRFAASSPFLYFQF